MKTRAIAISWRVGTAALFIAIAILVRGTTLGVWTLLNPDEAELMAQGRAAMVSFLPFSTWTISTTGPFFVQFLALLGLLGLPLTIAFAHLLSAVLVGVSGWFVFLLVRRALTIVPAIALTALVWLPVALVYPVGGVGDFGALSTEYFPTLLILGAALFSTRVLSAHPWLFAVAGLLSGIAVGSKYQVLPLALAVVAVQLLLLHQPLRRSILLAVVWCAGAAVPFVALVVALLVSPTTDWVLPEQSIGFLGAYSGQVTFPGRIVSTASLVFTQVCLFAGALVLVWLGLGSTRRVLLARTILLASGLAAIFAGGMGFGHYLIILYVALALAVALPLRPDAVLVPPMTSRVTVALAVFTAVAFAAFTIGPAVPHLRPTTPAMIADSLSPQSVQRDPVLEAACPAGSKVLIWGWASEYYSNYSWQNTVPYMNSLPVTSTPRNIENGIPMIERAVEASDCVIDAVGQPFFYFGAGSAIDVVYPEVAGELRDEFHVAPGLIDCAECRVFVRD